MSVAAGRHINKPFQKKELLNVSVEMIIGSPICKYV
jgi:hypothetical protein